MSVVLGFFPLAASKMKIQADMVQIYKRKLLLARDCPKHQKT